MRFTSSTGQASEPASATVIDEPSERARAVSTASVPVGSGGGTDDEDVPIRVQPASMRTVPQSLMETLDTSGIQG